MACCGGYPETAPCVTAPAATPSLGFSSVFVSQPAIITVPSPEAIPTAVLCGCDTIIRFPIGVSQVNNEIGRVVFSN